MALTQRDLEALQDAEALVDRVAHAAGVTFTRPQRDHAITALLIELEALRRTWSQRAAVDYRRIRDRFGT